jgi:hypothetical protein
MRERWMTATGDYADAAGRAFVLVASVAVVLFGAHCGGASLSKDVDAAADGAPAILGSAGTPDGDAPGGLINPALDAEGTTAVGPIGTGDVSKCPANPPTELVSCGTEALTCTYGTSIVPACRDVWYCSVSGWRKLPACAHPPAGYCPPAPPSGTCMNPSPVQGPGARVCGYDDGTICDCRVCQGTSASTSWCWMCIPPPSAPGCPAVAPNPGVPCSSQGLSCTFGDPCYSGAGSICRLGVWYPLAGPTGCGE